MSAELTNAFAGEQVFPTDLPPKYYLEYFNYVLAFVRKRYVHILHESELEFLDNYESLSEDAQCLFIRFSNRSKSFFRTNSLSYSEIEDMPAVLTELLECGFIESLCEAHDGRFAEVIDLFTKPELLEVTRLLQPEIMPSKSIKKPDLVRWLLYEYDFAVLCEVISEIEPVVKVSFEAEVMLMKFLFFGNRYADMTEFVVRDLGREPRPAVVHGEQDRREAQVGVQVLLDELDVAQQLREAFERVVLALDRNQHLACRDERVDRQQAE